MLKRVFVLTIMAVCMMIVCSSCSVGYLSDEPCEWCRNTPTKQIASENMEIEAKYYCEECVSECMFCSETATNHYTNLLELEVFVCGGCYEDVVGN